MRVGAQLYTVRAFTKTPEDLAETLKRIADIGYRTVQVSGTCPYEPAWLSDRLRENGLECVITHVPAARFTEDPAGLCVDHRIFGCGYIGLGYYDFSKKTPDDFKSSFSNASKVIAAGGMLMMFHNHRYEFMKKDGKFNLYHLADMFPENELGFTFDTYWAQAGGADVCDVIDRLSGRVPCVHFKDIDCTGRMMQVGAGNLNFPKIIRHCADAGTRFVLVEQDDCNGLDPFGCLKESFGYLRAQGLDV